MYMFAAEQKVIEAQIREFLASQDIPEPDEIPLELNPV